jgi:uncharacterized membrane protein HdeD (DUF308 family)
MKIFGSILVILGIGAIIIGLLKLSNVPIAIPAILGAYFIYQGGALLLKKKTNKQSKESDINERGT